MRGSSQTVAAAQTSTFDMELYSSKNGETAHTCKIQGSKIGTKPADIGMAVDL